jgi:hypothetical protein
MKQEEKGCGILEVNQGYVVCDQNANYLCAQDEKQQRYILMQVLLKTDKTSHHI